MSTKMRLAHRPLNGLILGVCLLYVTVSAYAGETISCANETLDGGTYGNVRVKPGTSCTLVGNVIVNGNLIATRADNLLIVGPEDASDQCDPTGLVISGNVSVKRATGTVEILDACVEGNVTLEQNGSAGGITVLRNCISGNLTINRNDTLLIFAGNFAQGGNVVGGHVSVTRNVVDIFIATNNSEIGGNVTVSRNESVEEIGVFGNLVGGNVSYEDNISSDIVFPEFFNGISDNTVSGNVTVKRNETIDPVQIDENVIDGNLVCKRNAPDPLTVDPDSGIANTVGGKVDCAD